MVTGSQLCCDLTKRLFNDVHFFVSELETFSRNDSTFNRAHEHIDNLNTELENKLADLIHLKCLSVENSSSDPSLVHTMDSNLPSIQHIVDFIGFIKLLQRSIRIKLGEITADYKYQSHGISLLKHLEQVCEFIMDVEKYQSIFSHRNCLQLFISLSNKVKDELYPELFLCDKFERSLGYLLAVTPCLIRIMNMVDTYLSSSRILTLQSLLDTVFRMGESNGNQLPEEECVVERGWLSETLYVLDPLIPLDTRPAVQHPNKDIPNLVRTATNWILSFVHERDDSLSAKPMWLSVTNIQYRLHPIIPSPVIPPYPMNISHQYIRPMMHMMQYADDSAILPPPPPPSPSSGVPRRRLKYKKRVSSTRPYGSVVARRCPCCTK